MKNVLKKELSELLTVGNLTNTIYDSGNDSIDLEFDNWFWVKDVPLSDHEEAGEDEDYFENQETIDKIIEAKGDSLEEEYLSQLEDFQVAMIEDAKNNNDYSEAVIEKIEKMVTVPVDMGDYDLKVHTLGTFGMEIKIIFHDNIVSRRGADKVEFRYIEKSHVENFIGLIMDYERADNTDDQCDIQQHLEGAYYRL